MSQFQRFRQVGKEFFQHFCFFPATVLLASCKMITFAARKDTKTMKTDISIRVSVYTFREGDNVIAYCPSLDLSGYGRTQKEAKESFGVVMKDYLDYCTSEGTLHEDLISHGWQMEPRHAAEPALQHMIRRNRELRDILDMPHYSKFSKTASVQMA